MLHLLHGADTFRSAARLRHLRAVLDPSGFNGVSLDGQDTTVDSLRGACDAFSFFGGGRCVDVRGLLTRWKERKGATRSGDAAQGTGAGDPFEALVVYLPLMPPTTTLILWEPGLVDLPTALRRALQDLGPAGAIERFDP